MNDETKDGVSDPSGSVSDPTDVKEEPTKERDPKEWDKLLKQRKATQAQNAELKERLAALEAAEQERIESDLAKQNQFKELAEQYKTQLETAKKEKGELESNFLDAHKLNAFREKLPGHIKKSEYYSFVDLDKIIVDPETKEIVEDSVDNLVNKFIGDFPDLYQPKDSKRLPSDAANPEKPKGYKEELAACKNQRELDAVLRKYGRS